MADYTEEQRVKQMYPDAYEVNHDDMCDCCGDHCLLAIYSPSIRRKISGYHITPEEAWADASRRLGNEFVDEVGPLAERKEG